MLQASLETDKLSRKPQWQAANSILLLLLLFFLHFECLTNITCSFYVIKEMKTNYLSRAAINVCPLLHHPLVMNLFFCVSRHLTAYSKNHMFFYTIFFYVRVVKLLVISPQSETVCVADCFLVPSHQFCHLCWVSLPLFSDKSLFVSSWLFPSRGLVC